MPLWQADAANLGDGGIKFAIKNYTPITKAACWGGPYCPPGHADVGGAGDAGVQFVNAAEQALALFWQFQKMMAGKPGHQATTRSIETSFCIRLRLPV
jgi:hypothetical protein